MTIMYCLPPKNFAQVLSSIFIVTTVIPKRNWKQCFCNILGVYKVYDVQYENGEYENKGIRTDFEKEA